MVDHSFRLQPIARSEGGKSIEEPVVKPGRRPPWQAPRFIPSLLWNYLISSLRHFNRQRAYSLINIVGLALGLAAFSLGALTAYVGFHYDAFHKNAARIYGVVQILPSGVQGDQHTAVTLTSSRPRRKGSL